MQRKLFIFTPQRSILTDPGFFEIFDKEYLLDITNNALNS